MTHSQDGCIISPKLRCNQGTRVKLVTSYYTPLYSLLITQRTVITAVVMANTCKVQECNKKKNLIK